MPVPLSENLPSAIALMGPTASGKSQLAINLANALNGEIISVDSALVYRGMDIGTAKPTPAEQARAQHHLIDILNPQEIYSTGQFRNDALNLMRAITGRGKVPILAGGTMLYYNALLRGLSELPGANADVREGIEREAMLHGWSHLHRQLGEIDPEAAARIHPNDPQRIQRALEVFRITGTPISELARATRPPDLPFRICKIILMPASREILQQNIRLRFMRMLEEGLIEEVEGLFQQPSLHRDLPSMRAVGYRQVGSYLAGEYGKTEMIERAIIATRQFAKRQMTWLRKETDAVQVNGGEALNPASVREVIDIFLKAGNPES